MELSIDYYALAKLFSGGQTLIDVRSPVEFKKAHLPHSRNLPLLTDSERAQVGLEYRLRGAECAIALGHSLVHGEVKEQRVTAWQSSINTHGTSALFCARGGLRSQIACNWLNERGIALPRIKGGYKALRRALLEWFDSAIDSLPLLVVAGQTGSGKTRFLNQSGHSYRAIDLEGIARHCGSSFGGIHGAQPSQATFENYLFVAAISATHENVRPILIEDESYRIGAITLPLRLLARIAESPRIVLLSPLKERIALIKEDYVLAALANTTPGEREAALTLLEDSLRNALQRISKRLGDQRLRIASALLKEAFIAHRLHGDSSLHDEWIALLLTEYYDPSYTRQLSAHKETIVAEGSEGHLLGVLKRGLLPPLRTPS